MAEPLGLDEAEAIVARTDRSDRDQAMDEDRKPARALAFMQLEPGDRVLDMFAGGGYYSELIARAVAPEGFVLAHNPASFRMRDRMEEAGAARGYSSGRLPNVAAFYRDFNRLRLAPASLDAVLFHLVYHDLYVTSADYGLPHTQPQDVLAQLNIALRPGGTVTVIDHVGADGDTRQIAYDIHRIAPERVVEDFRKAGFALVARERFHDNSDDEPGINVFDDSVRGETDRFALRFARAGDPNVADIGEENGPASSPDVTDQAHPCGAEKVADLLGRPLRADLRERILARSGAATLRAYEEGAPVTMDYRPDRLNIVTEAGTNDVLELKCG
ncbi:MULTISPECIES: I78 family peptidase inhibitor [Pacificimonas]|nr:MULTISPECIES: I78 family peptidase inhibitor [Pacificimonas]MBZ6377674.1 methyltransferase [Pacificimonas aurantium]